MKDKYFLDSNILIYSKDTRYPEKKEIANQLIKEGFTKGKGRISQQVLHEFYVTVTTKLKPGMKAEEAQKIVIAFSPWHPLALDYQITFRAFDIQAKYHFSFWDSLILSAALLQNCDVLYSEDMSHKMIIDNLQILNPFLKE